MANTTNTTAANFIPEIWTGEVQEAFHNELVMANKVLRLDDETKGGGDTLHIPQVTELSAGDKSAGTDITYSANTESKIDVSINKHKYTAFLLEDITKLQASYDLRSLLTKEISRSVAEQVDSDLTGLYSGLSQTVSGGTALDDADIISGIEKLDDANTPQSERFYVVDAAGMADLRGVDKFTQYQISGEKGVTVGGNGGMVANVYGVDVFMSNNIVTTGGTTVTHHSLLFHKEAFILAKQQDIKVEAEYSVDALGWKVAAHCVYGVAEYRDTSAVDVQYTT